MCVCVALVKAAPVLGVNKSCAELLTSADRVSHFMRETANKPFTQPLDLETKTCLLSLVDLAPDSANVLHASKETRGVDILHAALLTLKKEGDARGEIFKDFANFSGLWTDKSEDYRDRVREYFSQNKEGGDLAGGFFVPVSRTSALMPVSVLLQGALKGVYFVPIAREERLEVHHFEMSAIEAALHDVLHGVLIQKERDVLFCVKMNLMNSRNRLLWRPRLNICERFKIVLRILCIRFLHFKIGI